MRLNHLLPIVFILALLCGCASKTHIDPGASITDMRRFSEGFAATEINGKWGYINEKGFLAIDPQFSQAEPFSDGLAPVRLNEMWGIINTKGKYLLIPTHEGLGRYSQGLMAYLDNGKWGFISPPHKIAIPAQFDEVRPFNEGLAAARIDNHWGYIDKKGHFVINPRFTYAGNFSYGMAPVSETNVSGSYGYINAKGSYVIEPQFDGGESFSGKMAAVYDDGKWGYIDKKGRLVINLKYDCAEMFANGLAAVRKDGKWGYINDDGNSVIANQFKAAFPFMDEYALVLDQTGQGYHIDRKGTQVLGITGAISEPVQPDFPYFPYFPYFSYSISSDFVVISDVHFNPFSDPSLFNRLVAEPADNWDQIFKTSEKKDLPRYGSESNYALLSKALDSAAAAAQSPVMVIFPGDILGHGFDAAFYHYYGSVAPAALKQFIYKTVRFFVLQIKSRFPNQPVLFTLGNNDAYAGDYDLVAGGDFLSETAPLFMNQWLGGRVQAKEFNSTYKAGGYYTVDSGLGHIRLLSLNSVLFSTHRPAPVPGDAAYVQLNWFEGQLAAAQKAGQKVYVVTHVPPGVDVFQTVRKRMDAKGRISGVSLMWHDDYQKRFLEIMEKYKELNMVFFSGHTHMDEFRLLSDDARTSHPDPILGQPAISPIFGNNPGYRLIHVSATTWQLENYTTHYLPLGSANDFSLEYEFSSQYGLNSLDGSNMEILTDNLAKGGTAKTDYIDSYYLKSSKSPIVDTNWPAYRCSTKYVRASPYKICVNAPVQ